MENHLLCIQVCIYGTKAIADTWRIFVNLNDICVARKHVCALNNSLPNNMSVELFNFECGMEILLME